MSHKVLKEKRKETPNTRHCIECPRWALYCKPTYDHLGTLMKKEFCPLWNGSYDSSSGLWYYQDEKFMEDEQEPSLENDINQIIKFMDIEDCHFEVINLDENNVLLNISFIGLPYLKDLTLKIQQRKIDLIVDDNEYLFKLFTLAERNELFVKTYQYMKKFFKKMQLRGGSNKIYMEMYDKVNLEEHIFNFINTYIKALNIIDFELSDKRITLENIFSV